MIRAFHDDWPRLSPTGKSVPQWRSTSIQSGSTEVSKHNGRTGNSRKLKLSNLWGSWRRSDLIVILIWPRLNIVFKYISLLVWNWRLYIVIQHGDSTTQYRSRCNISIKWYYTNVYRYVLSTHFMRIGFYYINDQIIIFIHVVI